jgi:hypothetical protein
VISIFEISRWKWADGMASITVSCLAPSKSISRLHNHSSDPGFERFFARVPWLAGTFPWIGSDSWVSPQLRPSRNFCQSEDLHSQQDEWPNEWLNLRDEWRRSAGIKWILMTGTIWRKWQPPPRIDKVHDNCHVNHSIHIEALKWQCDLIGILSDFRPFVSNSFYSRRIWFDSYPNFIHSHAIWFDFDSISFDSPGNHFVPEG